MGYYTPSEHLFHVLFHNYTNPDTLEQLAEGGEHIPRVRGWLGSLTACHYIVKHRPGKTNGNANLLSRVPLPPMAVDFSPACRFIELDAPGVNLIRRFSTPIYALDLQCPGTGMRTEDPRPFPYDAVLGGLEEAPADFADFCTFGPRTNISAPPTPAFHLISDNTRSRSAARADSTRAPAPPKTPAAPTSRTAPVSTAHAPRVS